MTPTATIDPRLCPLCGQPNRCAMEVERETGIPQGPCWCTTAVFDQTLLARLDPAAQGKACICERCSQAARDPR
ncbi:MAG: cysteine-rich CWC family protein [Burkholderiales bacterium]|nr:cysteine-rich CWC family protein [Burkholderiales bacterium]